MTRQEKLAMALLKPINTSAIVILGVYTFIWGLWVCNPFWSVFSQAPLYDAMGALLPEYFWGLLAVVTGVLTIYGSVKRSYATLITGAFASGWFWTIIAIFYFLGDFMNTGGITSATFAIYSGFIYLNIRINHRFGNIG